jgi:hypothetical protein
MTASTKFRLKPFDANTWARTRAEWARQLSEHEGEIMASEWERILEWAGRCLNYGNATEATFAYGIFREGAEFAEAIVEIVYQRSAKKWLKLLNLYVCPSIDLTFAQALDIKTLVPIYAAAVFGTVQLTSTAHPTRVSKLYGRSGTLLTFLSDVCAYIGQDADLVALGVKVRIEGRWLVFSI